MIYLQIIYVFYKYNAFILNPKAILKEWMLDRHLF